MSEIHNVGKVSIKCNCESLLLDLDAVTALGIVLAELVTNSYDHAFTNGYGSITVTGRAPHKGNGANAILTISDTGNGFVPVHESKRHGLGLVRRLVQQLNGTVNVKSDHGTIWEIEFPVTTAAFPM